VAPRADAAAVIVGAAAGVAAEIVLPRNAPGTIAATPAAIEARAKSRRLTFLPILASIVRETDVTCTSP
jgi:hypothetical protein